MVAIAIPSSCVGGQTCYSLQQATTTLHEISRACSYFSVTEIIVYDVLNLPEKKVPGTEPASKKIILSDDKAPGTKPAASLEARLGTEILQYFLTPPHLRKQVFGDLKPFFYAAKLPKLPGLGQFNKTDHLLSGISVKREGVKKEGKKSKKERAHDRSTVFVNVGFDHLFELEEDVPVHKPIVIDLKTKKPALDVPSPKYTVRPVDSFSKVFVESPVEGGYTYTIAVPTQEFHTKSSAGIAPIDIASLQASPKALYVFGRWDEIKSAIGADSELQVDAETLFDGLLAGYSEMRLEDAVMASMARLTD